MRGRRRIERGIGGRKRRVKRRVVGRVGKCREDVAICLNEMGLPGLD